MLGSRRSDRKQKVTTGNENNMKDFDKKNIIKTAFSKLQHKISEEDLKGSGSSLFRENSESFQTNKIASVSTQIRKSKSYMDSEPTKRGIEGK